jgi:hypothetical protein
MNTRAQMILGWIRKDSNTMTFSDGYTYGFMRAAEWDFEPWERAYLQNVLSARQRGVSA